MRLFCTVLHGPHRGRDRRPEVYLEQYGSYWIVFFPATVPGGSTCWSPQDRCSPSPQLDAQRPFPRRQSVKFRPTAPPSYSPSGWPGRTPGVAWQRRRSKLLNTPVKPSRPFLVLPNPPHCATPTSHSDKP